MPAVLVQSGVRVDCLARRDARLESIRLKVEAGERLSIEDGDLLFATPDIHGVCELADLVRRRLHGDVGFYNINRHLNYSNVCALSCKFCEFARKKDDARGGEYTRDMGYVREQTAAAVEGGATEMHVVGGLHPYLPWAYYPELVRTIAEEAERGTRSSELGTRNGGTAAQGKLHIKAFTAVEIVHLAKIAKVWKADDRCAGIRWVLKELMSAGLGSLPGGGAEVFDDRVHDEAFKGKIRSDVWLDVHRVAHELGLNTNATLLYGHVEQRHDRLIHMEMLRREQDAALARVGYAGVANQQSGKAAKQQMGAGESGHLGFTGDTGDAPVITLTRPGVPLPSPSHRLTPLPHHPSSGYYQTIIPLPFFPDGSELERLPGPGGLENLRTLAVARLMLDNFPHVKAFWIMQTLPMAQLMLQNGADDIDGTVVWYDITKVSGAGTHQEVTVGTLQKAIRDAGFRPVERDTLYRPVKRDGARWRIDEVCG